MPQSTRRVRTASASTSGNTYNGYNTDASGSSKRSPQPRARQSDTPYGKNRPNKNQPSKNRGRSGGPNRRTSPARTPAAVSRATVLERALDEAATMPADGLPTTFAAAGLPERLVDVLTQRGMSAPFAIQARTLRDALAGRDVLGRAQTGSGKTLAFGLPMLSLLSGGERTPKAPRGLVLVPTRELAQQVTDALSPLGRAIGVRTVAVYGGASIGRQVTALADGADIVVATPGRLVDLIERRACSLARVSMTVLDEADYMSDLGFLPAVTKLLDMTPEDGQRLLFSATLDRGVDTLVERYLTDPALHAVAAAAAPVEAVDHRVFAVRPDEKVTVAAEIAERPGRTLIFVRTKHGADRLARQLKGTGVHAAAIHGNRTQGQRNRALAGFAAGAPRVLIATDVAARGIHVDNVDLVVHFDPPGDHKDYLHRSGRTARAGATGTVVSLIHEEQRRELARLHDLARVNADYVQVGPGTAPVREIATSGEPIVVTATEPETEATTSRPPRKGPRGARRPRSIGQGGTGQGGGQRGGQGRDGNRNQRRDGRTNGRDRA